MEPRPRIARVLTRSSVAPVLPTRAPDALITTSRDNLILSWNNGAAQLTGFSAHEVIGKNIAFLFSPRHREIDALNSRDAVSGVVIRNSMVKMQAKSGDPVSLIYALVPMLDRAGRVVGLLRICKDISAFKQARQALELAACQLQGMDRVEDPILQAMRSSPATCGQDVEPDALAQENRRSRQGFLRIAEEECNGLRDLLDEIQALIRSR